MNKEQAIKIATGLRTNFKCESDTMVDFCNTIIKALEQEPCDDCVSRQAVLDKAYAYGNGLEPEGYCVNVEDIQALPPIQPKAKVGHWIKVVEVYLPYMCSECGKSEFRKSNYCPNCGAEMQGGGRI